jgi:hypothetical protein
MNYLNRNVIQMWFDVILNILEEGVGIKDEHLENQDPEYPGIMSSLDPDSAQAYWVYEVSRLLIGMRAIFRGVLKEYEENDEEDE